MPLISVWACCTETPGLSRPITGSQNDPRALRCASETASGFHISASAGTRSSGGITPMISCGDAVEHDGLADDVRGAAELPLPQAVREQDDRVAAGLFLCFGVEPAEHRLEADDVVKVGRGARAADPLRFLGSGQRECGAGERGDMLVGGVLLAPVAVVRIRTDVFLDRLRPVVEPHHRDPVGIGVGQRPQQDAVEHAEHRRVHPDPDREGQKGDRRESRVAEQHADRVTNVTSHRGEVHGASQKCPGSNGGFPPANRRR